MGGPLRTLVHAATIAALYLGLDMVVRRQRIDGARKIRDQLGERLVQVAERAMEARD